MNKKIIALLLAGTFVFAGCDNKDKADTKQETKVEEKAEKPAEEGKEAKDENKKEEANFTLPDNKVTLKAASYKFESHVGGAPYKLTEASYEQGDKGEAYYEFEGEKDGKEYSLKVNANTAEAVEAEVEKESDKDQPVDLGKSIPPEEAMNIALKSNGGGKVKSWKLYNDGKGEKYEIELEDGKEITINAINKKIL